MPPTDGDDHVRIGLFAYLIDKVLDFVGNVGDDLHRAAQVFAAAFPAENAGEYLAGGQVGVFVQIFIDKTLVMAQYNLALFVLLG